VNTQTDWCLVAEFAARADGYAEVLRCVALALDLGITVSVRRYGPFVRLDAEGIEAAARLIPPCQAGDEATADKRKAAKK
jgi:hypothetical protein